MEKKRQMARRVAATMASLLAWVIFIVLFALVWAPSLSLFQNIVILIASFVAAVTVGAGAYALEEERQRAGQVVATMATLLAWIIFIVLFVLLWAPSLSLFQNIVILIASLVAAITVGVGAYGLRYGWEPSRSKGTEHVGAAVAEAVKEKISASVAEAVKEKLEERGLESERE